MTPALNWLYVAGLFAALAVVVLGLCHGLTVQRPDHDDGVDPLTERRRDDTLECWYDDRD